MADVCTRSTHILFHNTQSLNIKCHTVVVFSKILIQNLIFYDVGKILKDWDMWQQQRLFATR